MTWFPRKGFASGVFEGWGSSKSEKTLVLLLWLIFVVNATYMKALALVDPSLHSPLAAFPSLCSAAPTLLSTRSLFMCLT